VAFYAFNANGTDRYPPFTLADVSDYPARLTVDYPERQRKGLPLIGWWLAGIPQYLVASVFLGGGAAAVAWSVTHNPAGVVAAAGLIGMLVFFAAIVLLFRGEYARQIFDFVLGLNRWVLRVGAYAALMTREYPPFRIDSGENEPGVFTISPTAPVTPPAPSTPVATPAGTRGCGAGRVTAVVLGSLAALAGLATLAAGGTALVFDQTQRDASGYLMTSSSPYSTHTYALVSDSYRAGAAGDLFVARDMLGTIRIRTHSSQPLFIGIARASRVDSYLAGVRREVATRFDAKQSDFQLHRGAAPALPPTEKTFWSAHTVGAGTQTLAWTPKNGNWRIVLVNPDGSAGVHAELAIGARFPHLLWIGLGALGAGALLILLGGGGLYAALRRRT
jgi:hypothetical protein